MFQDARRNESAFLERLQFILMLKLMSATVGMCGGVKETKEGVPSPRYMLNHQLRKLTIWNPVQYYSLNAIFKQAEEKLLAKNQDKEYAPIHGLPEFTGPAAKLAFGDDSEVIKNSLVCISFKTV